MDPDSFKLRGSRNLESPNYYGYTTQTFCIPVLLTDVYVPLFRILIGPFAALWGTWGAKSGAAFIPALSVGPSYSLDPKERGRGVLQPSLIPIGRDFGHFCIPPWLYCIVLYTARHISRTMY